MIVSERERESKSNRLALTNLGSMSPIKGAPETGRAATAIKAWYRVS